MAIIMAWTIIKSNNIINSIITLAAYSLICALLYILMDAPDVSLTEAAINACISTCILLVVQKTLIINEDQSNFNLFIFLLCFLIFLILTFIILTLFPFGSYETITNKTAAYYLDNTHRDIGINSVVAAILASYRGYDTLGETLVILTAGISVIMILQPKNTTIKKNAK
jgi:multicomponent Na+:H+ antiporter subunit B